MKHTPGPWHLFPSNPLCIEANDGNVALCNLARANEADARLIAAAPETRALMLRAIDAMAAIHRAMEPQLGDPEMRARVPAAALRTFVDELARLHYEFNKLTV